MMLNNDPSNNVDYRNDFLSYATRLSLAPESGVDAM